MSGLPNVIFSGCTEVPPVAVVQNIFKNEKIDLNLNTKGNSSKWTIDTKYYTAEVNVHFVDHSFVRDEAFNSLTEAVLIYDEKTEHSNAKLWDEIISSCEPEIRLFLVKSAESITSSLQKWCTDHEFELINLNPDLEESQDDLDELIIEKIGSERVIEALQTHMWPNLAMKSSNSALANIEAKLDSLTSDEFSEFSDLFQHLSIIKESVQSMPLRERRQCAEQVVTAFWQAIGGDEEELLE